MFYCWYVYDIINTVEENDIGDVNTAYNWGNTIIINHLNGLFSQISHVKKDSFNVFVGQYVTKGTFLATCGNSGRSPEPHIHFQLQTIPTIGAVTLPYPIAYFIERNGIEKTLHISEVPKQGSFISNIQVNELLCLAFSLLPGKILKSPRIGSKRFWRPNNLTGYPWGWSGSGICKPSYIYFACGEISQSWGIRLTLNLLDAPWHVEKVMGMGAFNAYMVP